jgi:hypothetical protein
LKTNYFGKKKVGLGADQKVNQQLTTGFKPGYSKLTLISKTELKTVFFGRIESKSDPRLHFLKD